MPFTPGETNSLIAGALFGGALTTHAIADDNSMHVNEKTALSLLYVPGGAAIGASVGLAMHALWPYSLIVVAAPSAVYLLSHLYGKTTRRC